MNPANIFDIIVRPLVTEKGSFLVEKHNTYAFEVSPKANKVQIRKAIEEIYNVKVAKVRTMTRKGKPRRAGRVMTHAKNWKRALVQLHPDHQIDLF